MTASERLRALLAARLDQAMAFRLGVATPMSHADAMWSDQIVTGVLDVVVAAQILQNDGDFGDDPDLEKADRAALRAALAKLEQGGEEAGG